MASKVTAGTQAPSGRRHSRRLLWAPFLIYFLLTPVMTWPLAREFTRAIPGDSFDGWQNLWNLWWLRVALVERVQWPLVTDLLYAPTGVSLYFHTLNPFNGLLVLPIQIAGGSTGLYLAYNIVVVFSFALSGYGAFLLTRWVLRPRPGDGRAASAWDARWWAALVAGATFAFAPIHMAHLLGHMQVFAYQWLPFAALALLRNNQAAVRRTGHWARTALMAALFFVLAALCDWYFALYLFLFALGAFVWQTIRAGAGRDGAAAARLLVANALAGGVALLILAPLLVPMVREAARNDYMLRPAEDLYLYSATAVDFLIPSRMHSQFRPGSAEWPGNQVAPISERTLAVGYVTLALALAGLALDRRRSGGWLVAALLFALLALGPRPAIVSITAGSIPAAHPLDEWSLYNLANRLVPFMRISRSVARFGLMVELALAAAAACGLNALLAHTRVPRARTLVGAGALVLVLAEFWVAPFPMSPPDTPAWYTSAGARAEDPARPAILNLPMNYDRPGYLLYQTAHKRPLTVAYISRDDPRTLTERVPLLQHLRHLGPDIIGADLAAVGPTVLQDLGVGTVVLDRYKMPGGLERTYTEEVAALLFGTLAPAFEDDRLTVYTPPAVTTPAAYLRLGAAGWGPLTETERGTGRTIGISGAAVELLHGSGDESLTIEWSGEGALLIESEAGEFVQRSEAEAGGTTTVVPLKMPVLVLRAESGTLQIRELKLAQ